MFRAVYTYEIQRLLKQPATHFYFMVFFAIALLTVLGSGGFFDGLPDTGKEIRLLNSAREINFIFQYFNKFFLFLLPGIVGMVIYKDFRNNVHCILYSYPIKKSEYLLGKFLSAMTIVFLITLSIGMAFYLGEFILGKDNPLMGETNYWGYASAFLFFVWPNLFVFGLFVFVVVASLRNIYAGFISVILLIFVQIMVDNHFEGSPLLFAIFDPFGQNAVAHETRFWTISEQNVRQIPVLGLVLWNRLLWIALAISFFGLFYRKFQLEQESFYLFPDTLKRKSTNQALTKPTQSTNHYSKATIDFSFLPQLKAMQKLAAIDFRFMVKNWLFQILLLFGMLALVFAMSRVTNRADLTYLPLTRIVISLPMFFFSIIIMLLTFVYAGMLIHRSRMTKSNQLIDTTATGNWVLLGSKILALLQVQIFLLMLMMLCGIGIQLYNGYYQFEMDLYLFQLFVITFPTLMVWAALSTFIHTLVPNVYMGIFLLILIWMGKEQLHAIGIETYLLRFNSAPPLTYSDLNGFGHGLLANLIINAYWLNFSVILITVAYLFWERGYTYSLKERIQIVFRRFNGNIRYALLFLLTLQCLWGFYIFQEENSLYSPARKNEQTLNNFRDRFGKYKSAIQPKITSVKLNMEIFPESNSFTTSGRYLLVNQSTKRLDTLLIKTGYDEITEYSLGVPSAIIQKDEALHFAVHLLENPLESGDSILMEFRIKNKPNTIFYRNSGVLQNGTFLRSDILPRLGYFFDDEYYAPTDTLASNTNFYSPDADLVDLETIISTHPFQTAIAPGTLIRQWNENNRSYFHYKTEEKIKFAFAFNSGTYSVSKANHKGVSLEIYHHQNHIFNLKDVTEGLKASLDYNTQFFGPYQHAEIRTVEFPLTEGTYASVMSNAIPTSEVRFILRNGEENNQINLSFYVQAHELTHHWWGNQLMPANALGAKMLTESITEYISLRIYERYFGREKAQHFLSVQRQRYLEGRTRETGKEKPLFLVSPEQEYIAYGKGVMALNTLQYYLGEEKLNRILKDFLEGYKFKTAVYPTSSDLIAHLKSSVPFELHYIIYDMMETITFYDHQLIEIREKANSQLEITFSTNKIHSNPKKKQEGSKVFLTIGQYDNNGNFLHSEVVHIAPGENNIIIPKKPDAAYVLLDPFLHFMEMHVEDNRHYLSKKE